MTLSGAGDRPIEVPMSFIDRMSGRKHAIRLLQDGAELQTLIENAVLHPRYFQQGMFDVLYNEEVQAFINRIRDTKNIPKEPRAPSTGHSKKIEPGKYEAFVDTPEGTISLGFYSTKDKAIHAKNKYLLELTGPKDTAQYPGLTELSNRWFTRRSYRGQKFRSKPTGDYEQAIRDWTEINEAITKLRQCLDGYLSARNEKRA